MSNNKLKKLMAKGASRIERAKDQEADPVLVKAESQVAGTVKEEATGTETVGKEPAGQEFVKESIKEEPVKQEQSTWKTDKEVSGSAPPDSSLKEELSAQDKVILDMVRRNGFTADHLRLLERLAFLRNDFPDAIDTLGPQGASAIYVIARDDVYIRTAKLKLIAFMNLLTRNRLFHTVFRKAGALIESLRHLKDILFPL